MKHTTTLDTALEEILKELMDNSADVANFGSPFNTDDENSRGAEELYDKSLKSATQSITTYLQQEIDKAVIGELERIDGYAYGTDYGDYQKDRIATIKERTSHE